MHVRVRIHRWVIWWFCVGVAAGAVALVNIMVRDLPRTQERTVLIVGVLHWLVGGIFCYGFEGIKIEESPKPRRIREVLPVQRLNEWHSPSEFLLPGKRKSLLPPRY
jgi:hypothetical protein